jgi:hypothetical protein
MKGKYRLLILDGHESHHSTEFELYCQQNNIITLCMPPHSSHLVDGLREVQSEDLDRDEEIGGVGGDGLDWSDDECI